MDQQLTLSFYPNPIFVVRCELDQFRHSNLDALECKSSSFQFIGPNHLSLKITYKLDFFKFDFVFTRLEHSDCPGT